MEEAASAARSGGSPGRAVYWPWPARVAEPRRAFELRHNVHATSQTTSFPTPARLPTQPSCCCRAKPVGVPAVSASASVAPGLSQLRLLQGPRDHHHGVATRLPFRLTSAL